jgi:hypothetical protein
MIAAEEEKKDINSENKFFDAFRLAMKFYHFE